MDNKQHKIKVLSREAIKHFRTGIRHVVISVRDPDSDKVRLPVQTSRLDALYLVFHDIDKEFSTQKLKIFTEGMSALIWEFLEKYLSKVDLIIVNCEAGISRSAGIAGAISKVINGKDDYYFKYYCSNRLVYRTVLNEGIKRITKGGKN